ncbi:hypothetical protein AB1N83_013324 [Pleurotus pulmonarius]
MAHVYKWFATVLFGCGVSSFRRTHEGQHILQIMPLTRDSVRTWCVNSAPLLQLDASQQNNKLATNVPTPITINDDSR